MVRESSTIAAEQAAVDRMAALRDAGETYRAIAEALTAEGFEPPSGDAWYAQTVRRTVVREAKGELGNPAGGNCRQRPYTRPTWRGCAIATDSALQNKGR